MLFQLPIKIKFNCSNTEVLTMNADVSLLGLTYSIDFIHFVPA